MTYHGPKAFEQLYDEITKSAFKKHGFINIKILKQWDIIVGANLAKICQPQKITFEPGQTRAGVLHITVSNPAFSLELKSYEARIVERVATFFGYKAVSKIKISVKPKTAAESKKIPATPPLQAQAVTLSETLGDVRNEELKAALSSLYGSLFKEC